MKKWLMLALLPLLLALHAAGAGATILTSTLGGNTGYTATFVTSDKSGNNIDDYIDITVKFNDVNYVSLLLAKKVEQDKQTASSGEILPESLMTFIAVDKNKSPVLNVVNLIDNGVTVTASFNVVDPTFDPVKGLIAAFYRINDQVSGLPDLNNGFTCADFAIGPVCGGGSPLVLITSPHQVPVANSLMLLAIGLMALRVPQRCGKLS